MTYTLVEPCAGSIALTLHLLGARERILPYQGTKWRFREALAEMVRLMGGHGPPRKVVLSDPGPWGRTAPALLKPDVRKQILKHLELMASNDPRHMYDTLQGRATPLELAPFAAEHLYLQRLAFSGKAVGTRDDRWYSPGFNKTSGYGLEKRVSEDGELVFGEVNPMIPVLHRILSGYDLYPVEVVSVHGEAVYPPEDGKLRGNVVVYIDPPYDGVTGYPDGGMDRYEVVDLACAWAYSGASVIVSEKEPIRELQNLCWSSKRLYAGRNDTSPFRGQHEEWITYLHRST